MRSMPKAGLAYGEGRYQRDVVNGDQFDRRLAERATKAGVA
jgi:hypothetical protein